MSDARFAGISAGERSALASRGGNLLSFGSAGAMIEVIDATLLASSPLPSTPVGAATGVRSRLALYPEASEMPLEFAPVSGAALTVVLAAVAPVRRRGDGAAKIDQQRIPMITAPVSAVTMSQRMSPESLIRIP